jgi:DNA-binding transcriptional LysR family regulator
MNGATRSNLGLLVVFVAIADTGSVSAAAARLGMSQPAVSHALRRVRALVGDPLFKRSGNRLVTTPLAESMVFSAREVIEKGSALLRRSTFDEKTAHYTWRIAANEYALHTFGTTLLEQVTTKNPLLRLEFVPTGSHTVRDIASQRIDFAFWGDLSDPLILPPIRVTELLHESYTGVMCAGHPLAAKARTTGVSLDDWLSYGHVRVRTH